MSKVRFGYRLIVLMSFLGIVSCGYKGPLTMPKQPETNTTDNVGNNKTEQTTSTSEKEQ